MSSIVKTLFLLHLVLLLPGLRLQGQADRYVDSLSSLLNKVTSDTARADILFALSDYTSTDSATGVGYAKKAFTLELNAFYTGKAHFYMGLALFDYDHDRAIREFTLADSLLAPFDQQEAFLLRSRSWSNIAGLYQRKSENEKFVDLLLTKAIPLAEQAGDSSRVGRSYLMLALPFMNFGEYDKAIAYFEKSIAMLKRWDASGNDLADAYVNLAKCNILSKRAGKAKPLLDSAWLILGQNPESFYVPAYYSVLSMYYVWIKDFTAAEKSLNKGLEIAERKKYTGDIRMLLYGKVEIFEQQKEYGKAIDILKKLLDENHISVLGDKITVYRHLSLMEAKRGNMEEAFNWLNAYSDLKDSLYDTQTRLKISDLELKYNYSEKEKQLLLAQNKARLQQVYTGVSLAGFAVAVLAFLFFFRQRKAKTEQQLKSMEQQQQIEVTKALLLGEEKERSRLARELHDGMGGLLANVRMQMEEMLEEDAAGRKHTLIRKMDNSVQELRRIARNMMPESLLRSGLESAIIDLCQSFSTDRVRIEYQLMNIERSIPQQEQLIIYRIVQELLANALRHAGASEIFVQCSQAEKMFHITVEDNGVGFDARGIAGKQKGIGFENIRSRVEFLNGRLEVSSASNKGTVINIEIYVSEPA